MPAKKPATVNVAKLPRDFKGHCLEILLANPAGQRHEVHDAEQDNCGHCHHQPRQYPESETRSDGGALRCSERVRPLLRVRLFEGRVGTLLHDRPLSPEDDQPRARTMVVGTTTSCSLSLLHLGQMGGIMPQGNAVETTSRPQVRGLRLDIQALRAIAVLLVVADHMGILQRLPGSIHGGFVGVDVFFVISGFLITGHLLKEILQNGRFSYRSFYARRARRILPAAMLVLGVSTIAASVVFWPTRAWSSAKDALWALVFAANVNFSSTGVDYFSAGQASLFQHYWSLSVEEQFYLAWPVLILAAVWAAKHRAVGVVPTVATIVIVVGAASFLYACLSTASSPSETYFSTPARVFEFCTGALIAVLARDMPKIHGRASSIRKAGSILGLGLIALSVVIIGPNSPFPGPWAALPAAGTAIFIAAGTGIEGGIRLPVLSTRPVAYLGSISYSIYLWHWPVILLCGAILPESVTQLVVVTLSTGVLSVLSYHYVERRFLAPVQVSRKLARRRAEQRRLLRTLKPLPIMAGGIIVVAAMTAAAATLTSTSITPLARAGDVLTEQEQSPESMKLLRDVQTQLAAAAVANTWEGLSTPVDAPFADESSVLSEDCWNGREETHDHCILGDPSAPNTLAVLGDSIAMNWTPTLWLTLKNRPSWNLVVYAKVGCPYAAVAVYDTDGSLYENCNEFRRGALDAIRESRPEVLVLASSLKKTLPDASNTAELTSKWERGVAEVAVEVSDLDRVIALAPPPEGRDLSSCSNKFTRPSDCASEISGTWLSVVDATEGVILSKGRTFIDTGLWFCSSDGVCPAIIGKNQVRRDRVHMTQEYAFSLAPLMASWLFSEPKSQPNE